MATHPLMADEIDVLAIIPALNEEATIAEVLKMLLQQGVTRICVVDNGSDDRTAEIASQHGAQVITEPRQGYGQACWSGLQTKQAAHARWILFCDADGSDDLSQLTELLALRPDYDFILGNRRATPAGRSQLTSVQNFGNALTTKLLQYGWGYTYQDLGPLRLIRKQALDQIAMTDRGYGWTIEMQAKAVEQKLRICECPVNYRPRQGGQSKISGTLKGSVKAGQVILTTLGKLYWQKTGGHFWQQICMMRSRKSFQRGLLWAIALCIITGSLLTMPHGDFLNQPTAVPLFWQGISLMSLGFVASWGLHKVSSIWFWAIALTPRLILLAMYPGDDIWRYLWEGHIQTLGHNPYLLAPNADILIPLRADLPLEGWNQINHPHLPAIYPPVAQLGFQFLAAINPAVVLFKSAFVAADVGVCWLLSRRFGYLPTLLYAWNPLIIYSFAGGGHYDSWFLLPLVAAWLWWDRPNTRPTNKQTDGQAIAQKPLISAVGIGLSIAIKWMSLPILGFMLWQQKRQWQQVALILVLGILPMAIASIPFCQGTSCPVIPLQSPFVNYGRSAAFIPQIVGSLLPDTLQGNWIYALPLAGFVIWNLVHSDSIGQFIERYLIALMLLSPIIHAWYFTWLVPFAVASRNWGTRLVSLSAFVYFALPHGLALGTGSWQLTHWQQWGLWGPFILGLVGLAISTKQSVQSTS